MNPIVSAIQSESVILFNILQSAFLQSQSMRPIPIRSAPKNRAMIIPSGSSVISYNEPTATGATIYQIANTKQTIVLTIKKVLSFISSSFLKFVIRNKTQVIP